MELVPQQVFGGNLLQRREEPPQSLLVCRYRSSIRPDAVTMKGEIATRNFMMGASDDLGCLRNEG